MPNSPRRPPFSLILESLEDRLAPSGTPLSESFNTVGLGQLPAGWTQWSNNGFAAFGVSDQKALSAPRSLSSSTNALWVTARTWNTTPMPADVQVSAAVFADNFVPLQLIARGSNLDTGTPTYYGLAITSGITGRIVRVQNGVSTTLAYTQSTFALSNQWIRGTLSLDGTSLRAQLYRVDTNEFLAPNGRWQSAPAWAMTVQDSAISGEGFVGFHRMPSYADALYMDDYHVFGAAGDSEPPQVTITSPSPVSVLTGPRTVQVSAGDNVGVNRIEFYLDGGLRSVDFQAPYEWIFDSSSASNEWHQLTVRAFDLAGNRASTSRQIFTLNADALPEISIPRHYSHIRVAQLAYVQGQIGSFEEDLLRRAVDLVIGQPGMTGQVNAVAPGTPQLLYTNLSTLYRDLLTDWIAFADARGISHEDAFYHVQQPTPYSGTSPSSQPVNWFWNVYRDGSFPRNMTVNARGTSGLFTQFGEYAEESVYLGFPERFREVYIDLLLRAGSTWTTQIEYASAVGPSGTPTAWKRLSLLGEDTGGLVRSGRIWFNPPGDWKTASVNGSLRLYYLRFRTLTGGVAPIARSVLGRDYTGAAGGNSGTIPAFDYAADLNQDGYLNDSEWSQRALNKNARFVYESRSLYANYGQMRFATNPSNPFFRAWALDYLTRLVGNQPTSVGIMIDNSLATPPLTGPVRESLASYQPDYAGLLANQSRTLAPRLVMANTGSNSVIRYSTAYYDEFALQPLAHDWGQFEALSARLAERLALRTPSPYAVLDSLPMGGAPDDPRTQLATLAYYYLVADNDKTFINFFGGFEPNTSWRRHWVEAAAYNIGQALDSWKIFATGLDPSNVARAYRVYQRAYANALVLYKPLSFGNGVRGTLSDLTATTHALLGTYRPLLADGTLGDPLTQVTLRNGEGTILIRV